MSQVSTTSRWEWGAIAAMTALGAVLRCWSLGSVGLNHFDEGIYALSGLWILHGGSIAAIETTLIPYAPPGLSIVIGLVYSVAGVFDLAAVAGPLVFGIATIPLAAWLARRTFGPGAGAAAAALAVLCGPHVAFSRMAMTDVPFLFCWILAMAAGGRFLERPGLGSALALGLSVGLAQNFKYNGWLAGGVVGLVVCLDLASGGLRGARAIGRVFGYGILAAVVAALVYLPWFLFVERHAGYARLLAHHRSYMGGLATWLPYWRAQLSQHTALSGGPFWCGVAWGAAWCAALICSGKARALPRGWWACLIGGCVLVALVPNLPWWAGLASTAWMIRDHRPGVRLLAAWWLILSLLTPFYHPYARLWLPLEAAGWILVAGLIVTALHSAAMSPGAARSVKVQLAAVVAVLALAEAWLWPPRAHPLPGLLARSDGLRSAVASLSREAGDRLMISVRPAATFYLATEGSKAFTVVPSWLDLLKPVPGAWALLDGALLRQEHAEATAQSKLAERWDVVGQIDVPLGLPTLLDVDPGAPAHPGVPPTVPLLLLKRR